MKKKMVLSYFMGFSMGLLLLTLLISFFGRGDWSGKELTDRNAKKLQMENAILTQELEALKKINEELSQKQENGDQETPKATERETKTVRIEVSTPIRYEEIADRLVANGVYPYKNDLMMLMEMVHYDKAKGTKVLAARKIINDEVGHRNILKKYDTHRQVIRQALYEKELIQDPESFSKILYLFDTQTQIVPGEKSFRTNLSLREIADILMSDSQ